MTDPKKKQQSSSDPSWEESDDEKPPAKKQATGMAVAPGYWRHGLLASMDDPECKVTEDERVAVIKDKYPKARFHFLVLPKEDIDQLYQLTPNHVGLLEHMNEVGRSVAEQHAPLDKFRFGFHAKPSMRRLHLHVISKDLDSSFMKKKQHWNSFTTEFFLDYDNVLKELKENGQIKRPDPGVCGAMLNGPLRCHKCVDLIFPTMPKLKDHVKTHANDDQRK